MRRSTVILCRESVEITMAKLCQLKAEKKKKIKPLTKHWKWDFEIQKRKKE